MFLVRLGECNLSICNYSARPGSHESQQTAGWLREARPWHAVSKMGNNQCHLYAVAVMAAAKWQVGRDCRCIPKACAISEQTRE